MENKLYFYLRPYQNELKIDQRPKCKNQNEATRIKYRRISMQL